MHTFRHDRNLVSQLQGGFENVKFSRFNDTGCDVSAVFWADDEDRYKTWDYWTALENSQTEGVDLANMANFCRAVAKGVNDAYITDHGSAFGESLGISAGVSTIMTYTDTIKQMQAFIEPTLCHDYPDQCFSYCENTCLSTLTVRIEPTASPDYKLKICKKDDLESRCETYGNWLNTGDWSDRYRIFSPALPAGGYTAEFLDEHGDVSWPRGVNITYEYDTCNGGGLQEGDVEFSPPDVDPIQCNNLIINGDAEASSTDPYPWVYERNMGVEIAQGQGIGGSNAFADVKTESHDDGLTQHLDTRCFDLNQGRQYEVKAYVKLMNGSGQPVYCDPSIKHSHGCPRIMLQHGLYRTESEDFRWRRDMEIEAGITRARHVNEDGFQLVQGIVTVGDKLTDASNVRLFVERRANNLEMLVDNISMTLVSDSTCDSTEDLVVNGDFETGSSENWNDRDAEGFQIVSPGVGGGGYALKMTTGSAQQLIKSDCVEAGKRYMVSAKYRLLDWNGNPTSCNPTTNSPRCPEMALNAYNGNQHLEYAGGIARAMDSAADTDDGYSTLWGIYQPSSTVTSAEKLYLFFTYTGPKIIVDDITFTEMGSLTRMAEGASATELSAACGDLIVNGDTEFGIAGFWSGSGVGNDKLSTTTGFGGTGNAVRVTGRNSSWKGMWYSGEKYMDKASCLVPASKWKVSAQIRLLEQGSDTGADCDTSERIDTNQRCPRLRVRFYNEGDPYTAIREEIIYEYTSDWNKDGWNEFGAQVEIPSIKDNVINKVAIVVAEARTNVDIVVDNLSMTPL